MMKALLIVALAVAALRATPSDAAPTVKYADGRISADLRDADLVEVLAEVTKQAKLEVRGTPTAEILSIRLDAVPLVDALSRLLAGQSFALTYDVSGGLKGIRFLGASAAPWKPAASDATGSTPEVEPAAALDAIEHPVEVEGLLADALGGNVTDFKTIVAMALQNGDARVRADALRVALGVLADDPDFTADVLRRLDAFDDAAVADWLKAVSRDHAEEIARQTARQARSAPLRRRAAAVARLLRSAS
jgi:hypothetical protein